VHICMCVCGGWATYTVCSLSICGLVCCVVCMCDKAENAAYGSYLCV